MQYFGFAGSDAVDRGRAEIKARLLRSAPLTAAPKPVLQEPGDRDSRTSSESKSGLDPNAEACDDEGKSPLPADEQSELIVASVAGDDEVAEERPDEVKWIEPVFVEPVCGDGSAAQDVQTDTVVDEARAADPVPAGEAAADGVSSGAAHLEEVRVPSALPRPARFRWGRRPPASPELGPGATAQSKEVAAERDALALEVAALRRAVAAERAAAADEVAMLRLTLVAEREAAGDEIAALRKILTAEREAAADEIATLRTILAAQQEASVARATRIKAVLGATSSAPAASD